MSRFPWEYSTFHPPRKELSGLIFAEQRPMGAQPPDPWGRLGRHPGFQTRRRPRGLRRSFFGGKQRPRTVSRIKGGAQRPHPECQGLARLPAKETLIYVKKPGSAPKGLTFQGGGGACCSLAADLSPRAEALKSGHGRPRLAFRGPALRSVLWKRLQNPRAERFIPSERAAGKGCRVRRTPARNNFICQERLAADIGRVI